MLEELKKERAETHKKIKTMNDAFSIDMDKLNYLKGVRRGLDVAIKIAEKQPTEPKIRLLHVMQDDKDTY